MRKEPKDHGRGKQVEGPDLAGKRVIVLEDTSTTGGSPLKAIEALRKVGAEVAAVAVVVDRATGAREVIEAAGVPVPVRDRSRRSGIDLMARKKRDDEDAREQHDDEDDGTDWLLAQLVTGRTPESQQQPPASSEPPAAPAQPEPEALRTPAAPDLPLRPPSPRREEELDWFSLAEPPAPDAATRALPVVGEPDAVPPTPSR